MTAPRAFAVRRPARRPVPGAVRRAVRWVANILLATVVVACTAWLAPAFLGYERYVITGGSMSGTFEKGSVVFEKPVPVDELAVGDVITYQPPPTSGVSDLVTHRISRVQRAEGGGRLFTTKGDANTKADPWRFELTSPTQPVVEVAVPHVGWAFIALADRETRMLVIGAPAALVALGALVQLVRALVGGRPRGIDCCPTVDEGEPVVARPWSVAP